MTLFTFTINKQDPQKYFGDLKVDLIEMTATFPTQGVVSQKVTISDTTTAAIFEGSLV